jgi:hypothetical protein
MNKFCRHSREGGDLIIIGSMHARYGLARASTG